MIIDKNLIGMSYVTEVGGEEISEALNLIQKAYDEYLGAAWEMLEQEGKETGGAMIAGRGFAFAVAIGAFYNFLMCEAQDQVRDAVQASAYPIVSQMIDQFQTRKAEAKKKTH